jgi:hypothetical protein
MVPIVDIESLVPVATLVLGYGLNEISSRRRARRDLVTRWDADRRRVYASYLATADENHQIETRLKSLEIALENPEQAALNLMGPDHEDTAEFEAASKRVKELNWEERNKLWARRKDVKERLRDLEAEIELLSTIRVQASHMLLTLTAGDRMEYRKQRSGFLKMARDELNIPDQMTRTGPVRRAGNRIRNWWHKHIGGEAP